MVLSLGTNLAAVSSSSCIVSMLNLASGYGVSWPECKLVADCISTVPMAVTSVSSLVIVNSGLSMINKKEIVGVLSG